jgi:hypothetical protein
MLFVLGWTCPLPQLWISGCFLSLRCPYAEAKLSTNVPFWFLLPHMQSWERVIFRRPMSPFISSGRSHPKHKNRRTGIAINSGRFFNWNARLLFFLVYMTILCGRQKKDTYLGYSVKQAWNECQTSPGTRPSPTEPCVWTCFRQIWFGGRQDVLPGELPYSSNITYFHILYEQSALCWAEVQTSFIEQDNYTDVHLFFIGNILHNFSQF